MVQAKIEGAANSPINFDNINDQYRWHYRRIAKRGKEISDIFRTVFGNSQMMTRVRPVYGMQVAWYDVGREGIEFIKNYYGSPSNYFYAIAGAPYFHSSAADATNTATKQDIINSLTGAMNELFEDTNSSIDLYKALATYLNLHFFCYEAGPDTFGPNNIQAKADAMRDPQMKDLTVNFLNQWYAYGSEELLMWYLGGATYYGSQYGTWGLTENFENSPKLQGVNAVLAQTPTLPTVGYVIPATIDARKHAGYPASWNNNAYFAPNHDNQQFYLLNVPQAGVYEVWFEVATTSSNQKIGFSINESPNVTINLATTGTLTNYQPTLKTSVNLAKGISSLKLITTDKNYRVRNVQISLKQACVNVASVTLNLPAMRLLVSESKTLTATISPSNVSVSDIVWSSSNPAIATVDANGLVKGIAAGMATITATTADGQKTATSTITVESSCKCVPASVVLIR